MPDAPVLPPVTAETVREHMRAEHGGICAEHRADGGGEECHESDHWHDWPKTHTHGPPAADEGTTE